MKLNLTYNVDGQIFPLPKLYLAPLFPRQTTSPKSNSNKICRYEFSLEKAEIRFRPKPGISGRRNPGTAEVLGVEILFIGNVLCFCKV